jgi:hypothetical protein
MMIPNPFRFIAAMSLAFWYWICRYQVLASVEEQEFRMWQCYMCPFSDNGQCGKCSCFIPAKVVLASEQCPVKRWKRIKCKKNLTRGHSA